MDFRDATTPPAAPPLLLSPTGGISPESNAPTPTPQMNQTATCSAPIVPQSQILQQLDQPSAVSPPASLPPLQPQSAETPRKSMKRKQWVPHAPYSHFKIFLSEQSALADPPIWYATV